MLKFSSPDPLPALRAAQVERPIERSRSRKPKRSSQGFSLLAAALTGAGLVFGAYFSVLYSSASKSTLTGAEIVGSAGNPTTGEIVVTDGGNCRKLQFDNVTGAVKDTNEVRCARPAPSGASSSASSYKFPSNRLDEVRKSFSR